MVSHFIRGAVCLLVFLFLYFTSDVSLGYMASGIYLALGLGSIVRGATEFLRKVRQRKARIREEKLRAKRKETYEAALRIINSKTAEMCDVCPLSYFCKCDCGGICPILDRLKDAAAEEIEKEYTEEK